MLFLILLNTLFVYMVCSFLKNISVFYLVYFALIILNSELLSVFSSFDVLHISILTVIETVAMYVFFLKSKTKPYTLNFKPEFKKIINALKMDKTLLFTGFAFVFMLLCFFFLSISIPPLEPDARSYHFVRIFSYIKQANFSHFLTNEIRNVVMPFNSEMVYSYFYLFKKNDVGFAFLSYVSFINAIFQLYLIMKNFKFSTRKTLFTIFSLSSMGAILVQIPSLQTDIVVASLILTSVALVVNSFQSKVSKTCIFLSSLAYAISMGTKTTSLFILPAFLLLIFYLIKPKRYIFLYIFFLFFNFIVFSSYNYVLNFIDFGDFFAPLNLKIEHKSDFGDFFCNAKYFVVDFLGSKIAYFLHLPTKNDISIPFDERTVGFSLLGVVCFLVGVFSSFFRKFKNKRNRIILAFAILFLLNFLIICCFFSYSPYIVRYFVTLVLVSGVCVGHLYNIKILKNIILFLCISNLFLYSIFSTRFPVRFLLKNHNKEAIILNQKDSSVYIQYGFLNLFETKFEKEDKVAIIDEDYLYEIKQLMNFGYNIDVLVLDELSKETLSKYDYLVFRFYNEFSNNYKYFGKNSNYKCEYILKKYENKDFPLAKRCYFDGEQLNSFGFYFDEKLDVKNKSLYVYKKIK